jgi:hypothetical protein
MKLQLYIRTLTFNSNNIDDIKNFALDNGNFSFGKNHSHDYDKFYIKSYTKTYFVQLIAFYEFTRTKNFHGTVDYHYYLDAVGLNQFIELKK